MFLMSKVPLYSTEWMGLVTWKKFCAPTPTEDTAPTPVITTCSETCISLPLFL